MRIERFISHQFAGLRDVDLSFQPGLNVVVGANETGKSTIVNAMMAVLFVNPTLRMSRNEDKEFVNKYMPYPGGDFIDGQLDFSLGSKAYRLAKQWGSSHQALLNLPDGTRVTSEKEIEKRLQEIFALGSKTYQTVVFARQYQLKEALGRLSDKETVLSVKKQLTAAVMNLDGISIDLLGSRIDAAMDRLLKRWDFANKRPEGNRTYTAGVGQVLGAYYLKRDLEQQMDGVFKIEQELHQLGQIIHEQENQAGLIEKKLQQLEPMEGDILKRAAIEPGLNLLKQQSQELRMTSLQWPTLESRIKEQLTTLDASTQRLEHLKQEEQACRNQAQQESLSQILTKVQANRQKVVELISQRDNLAKVTSQDIKQLEQLQQTILRTGAAMQAGKLTADIKVLQDLPLFITRDLEAETESTDQTLEANGYLRIRVPDWLDIEVKSGEIDFDSLKETYTQANQQSIQLLTQLGVETLDKARLIRSQREDLDRQISILEQSTASLLNDQTAEEIKAQLDGLGQIDPARPLPIVLKEKSGLEKDLIEVKARLQTDQQKLQGWVERYQDQTHLLDRIINLEIDVRHQEGELAHLQPLPENFATAGDFHTYLKSQGKALNDLRQEIITNRKSHDDKERELPDESYQELRQQWQEAENQFNRLLAQADKLNRIKTAFIETRIEMESDPLQPLIESFSRYLTRATAGKYTLGKIGDDFELRLLRQDGAGMPESLFSSGTYDCAALALRFALLEQLFSQEPGCVVLDDCLVDLDPERREQAAGMIREYAAQNQVIFTTCTPQTAELLGGNNILLRQAKD